MALFNIKVK
jgi:uncharacterized membrane protein